MEIINSCTNSLSITPSLIYYTDTDFNNDVSITTTNNNIYFFSGIMDNDTLYNITSVNTLLTDYASQYIGRISNVSLLYTYIPTKKQRKITQTSKNSLKFKDMRYVKSTFNMGGTILKSALTTKYKLKINNCNVSGGFKVNGVDIQMDIYDINSDNTFNLISEIFTSSIDLVITNSNTVTHSGVELIPMDEMTEQPLSIKIGWCAIRIRNDINGDYFIFTDDIGTRENLKVINLNSDLSTYSKKNIISSINIDVRDKIFGDV